MAWKKYEPDAEIKGGAIDIYPTGTLRFNRTVWEELERPEFITIHHDEEKGRLGFRDSVKGIAGNFALEEANAGGRIVALRRALRDLGVQFEDTPRTYTPILSGSSTAPRVYIELEHPIRKQEEAAS